MTSDLVEVFADAMADLHETLELLDEHGPGYLKRCLDSCSRSRRLWPQRPGPLPPVAARLVRELADDALVRAAPRGRAVS